MRSLPAVRVWGMLDSPGLLLSEKADQDILACCVMHKMLCGSRQIVDTCRVVFHDQSAHTLGHITAYPGVR